MNECSLLFDLQADAFFGAAHEEVIIRHYGVAPDLAVEHVIALQLGVFFGSGLRGYDLTLIAHCDHGVAGEDYLSRSESRLAPFDLARADVHTSQGASAILLEAEHTVKVAVFDDGRAPMIRQIITFLPPNGLGGKGAAIFADLKRTRADTVTRRAVNDVLPVALPLMY